MPAAGSRRAELQPTERRREQRNAHDGDRDRHRPRLAAGGLLVTAVILAFGEWGRRRRAPSAAPDGAGAVAPRELGWKEAILIGLAQALAIWPGVSRSGSTIACGLVLGLDPAVAARFSFLLSIPAILGALVLGLDAEEMQTAISLEMILLGAIIAATVGYLALKLLLGLVRRGQLSWFAPYCWVLGLIALIVGW